MAAAPSHYIRTIHTPFTAASSSWASASSVSRGSQTLNHHHHNHLSNITALNNLGHPLQGQFAYARAERDQPNYSPSINSHNSHFYTQHLQSLSYVTPHHHHNNNVHQLSNGQYVSISPKAAGLRKNAASSTSSTASHGPSGAGGGRRRSASIRVPPPSFVPTHAPPPQTYKFDPFGDEPLSSAGSPDTAVMPLSSGSQANRLPSTNEDIAEPEVRRGSAPYTIHIPPAQPIEIQRYSPPRSPRPAARTLTPKAASLVSLGPISPPRSSPAPADVIVPRQQSSGGPNLSKIVAGILLNRVHAVGKPMRRRVLAQGQGYRKSCLSSVVSVEA